MIARSVFMLVFSVVTLACAVPVQADWLCEFFHTVARDTKRRNCWPKPFVCPDRFSARAPFAVMINNGWRFQNMLGDHHFVPESGELTEAGRLKVHWILTQAPQQHRTIYVYRGTTPELTASRIAGVHEFGVQLVPDGVAPVVLTSDVPPRGWAASQVDFVGRRFEASAPDPRLPQSEGTGGGSE